MMEAKKTLEITIKPSGEMSVETKNISGATECTKVIEGVLAGVGGANAATEIKKTEDFWDGDRKVYTNTKA